MENRKLIYLFGMMFSILFASLYFFLFNNFITANSTSKTLYFNQVGLYKDEANSAKMIQTLKEEEIEAFAIKKEDVMAVVCSIHEDQSETQKQQANLTNLSITFIEKKVTIEDPEILTALESKDYKKVLEMMTY